MAGAFAMTDAEKKRLEALLDGLDGDDPSENSAPAPNVSAAHYLYMAQVM